MTENEALAKIKRGCVTIISEEELSAKFRLGHPLKIKLGVDPTAPDLHLGHTVALRKLRQFQDLGHKVIFIIGDFTAKIGDPSGRSETRPPLNETEILKNSRTYQDQVFKLLDKTKTEILFNSQWLYNLGLDGLLELSSHSTVAQMLTRDDFKNRHSKGIDISLVEFLYPLLQGYDSVATKSDVEIGGTDQTFNLLVGRDLQRDYHQPPQIVITMPLLEGLDGIRKMSKSYGNSIGITEPPQEMFGKIMSIPDNLMYRYYELLTDHNLAEIKKLHPRQAKARLAREIVAQYHNVAAATKAEEEFEKIFANKGLPEKIAEYIPEKYPATLIELLCAAQLSPSKKESQRLLDQGGIKIDGEKIAENKILDSNKEFILQVGKRKFLKIIPGKSE
ncbi:MAG: tyrosine--tRNA ligase [Elusimicrobiota bacterium]